MQEYRFASSNETACTVGVIHFESGMFFFKNRDLENKYHLNQLTVYHSTPEFQALKGVNLNSGELEGVAFGVNRHKVCVANTHVESTPDVTYDVLCERLLAQVQAKSDIPQVVQDFMSKNDVQGGRILVSAPGWTYLVEVFKETFQIQAVEGSIAITNNFSLISYQANRPKIHEQSSLKRLEVAKNMIGTISTIGDLKSMLRSHVPEKGELSICNHQEGGGGTESSHIVQIQGDYVGWSSLLGYPCENDYRTVQLFQ